MEEKLMAKQRKEIEVNLPDIPVQRPDLVKRCRIHADKMQDEGWYTTANVLDAAANALENLGYKEEVNDQS
jgi:hypothetical protein